MMQIMRHILGNNGNVTCRCQSQPQEDLRELKGVKWYEALKLVTEVLEGLRYRRSLEGWA